MQRIVQPENRRTEDWTDQSGHFTWHMSPVSHHLKHFIWYNSTGSCHLSHITWSTSVGTSPSAPHVTWDTSTVTYHLSHVNKCTSSVLHQLVHFTQQFNWFTSPGALQITQVSLHTSAGALHTWNITTLLHLTHPTWPVAPHLTRRNSPDTTHPSHPTSPIAPRPTRPTSPRPTHLAFYLVRTHLTCCTLPVTLDLVHCSYTIKPSCHLKSFSSRISPVTTRTSPGALHFAFMCRTVKKNKNKPLLYSILLTILSLPITILVIPLTIHNAKYTHTIANYTHITTTLVRTQTILNTTDHTRNVEYFIWSSPDYTCDTRLYSQHHWLNSWDY